MPAIANRLLHLRADRAAPAQARAAVFDVLHEARLTDLLDDALLLATELTTNAVVHAGTDITVQIEADEATLTVTVCDQRRHEIPEVNTTSGATLATGGRGLLLVDRIADRWGTVHDEHGKSVWFELHQSPGGPRARIGRALAAGGTEPITTEPVPNEPNTSEPGTTDDGLVRQLMAENDRLRRSELRRRASLTFMAEASELLAQSLDIDLTAALIPRLVVPRLGDWCALYRCIDGGDPELASATHADESATTSLLEALDDPSTRQVLRACVHPGERGALTTAEGVAVPLVVRGRRLGVLAVGRPAQRRHDPEELTLIADLARRAALAIDNAALHAERALISDTLQQTLLPPTLPEAKELSFAGEYIPTIGAADVGGDFYDVLPLSGGRWLMVIGDVSGKGVAAAAVTGVVRDVIRILARDGRSVPEILDHIHQALTERGAGRFATLAVAEVEQVGSQLRVTVRLAGHERPILVGADGSTTSVGAFGTVVGLLDTVRTTGVDLVMAPGDTLVFFTDGVTERRRGEELFGLDRTLGALSPLAGHDADIVAARLRAAAIGFSTEPPRDDIAILTLHNNAVASGPAA